MPGWGAAETQAANAALGSMSAAIDDLAGLAWQRLTEEDLLSFVRRLETAARRLLGPQLALTREIEARDIAGRRGYSSTAKLLSDLVTISSSEAGGRVQAARLLLTRETLTGEELPPLLPVAASAVESGWVGPDQLRVITRTMTGLPPSVDQATRDLCETTLVQEARQRPAPALQAVADQIRAITNADGPDGDLAARDRAELTIGVNRGDGLSPVRGLLDSHTVEHLRQAIEPLAAPRPGDDGRPDPRSAATRRAQALGELARRWLNLGQSPTSRGVRPHATITCSLADLRHGVGASLLDYAGPVGHRLARLVTCDSDAALQYVDEHGRFVDGTGTFRLFNAAQRRALASRDGGCAWPGCDTPAAWTDAHHIRHWADGGQTVVDNGVLLCGHHHGYIHRSSCAWEIRLDPSDRKPWFLPPTWLDPGRKPRRNTVRALIKILLPARQVQRR